MDWSKIDVENQVKQFDKANEVVPFIPGDGQILQPQSIWKVEISNLPEEVDAPTLRRMLSSRLSGTSQAEVTEC